MVTECYQKIGTESYFNSIDWRDCWFLV